ncbi:MAG: ABC transporter permease [Bacilli bacterium]|jgi:ABC-2 type transport system permease protein
MSKKLKYLTKVSLNKKIKTKWFLVVNIILVIAIVSLVNIDNIITFFGGSFGEKTNIIVIDQTEKSYDLFKNTLKGDSKEVLNQLDFGEFEIKKSEKTVKKETKKIKNNKTVLVVFKPDEENVLKIDVITDNYIDTILYHKIISAANVTKSSLAMMESNISMEDLMKINQPITIERTYLDESKTQSQEDMETMMSTIFPTLILPFFMLIIIVIQMLGAEINEEKSTRGMEIIISNVSPKTHFISKILGSNLFVLIQGTILFLAGSFGLLIRKKISQPTNLLPSGLNLNGIWSQLVESGVADRLIYIIPLTLLLIVLSFIAYSLLAGILASMTTSMEDFSQLQTPIIFICLASYYLAILAPIFEGSIFIRVLSYIPFLSALISPALLFVGQIGLIDIFISVALLGGLIYLLTTYGLKVYKVGILNYSTSKLWLKMFKAIKE